MTVAANAIPKIRGRNSYVRFGKRALDLCICFLLLPIFIPLIAILYVLVRLDGGPGFYGHARKGLGGRSFNCWKMRSMSIDADARLTHLLESDPVAAAQWRKEQKLARDPRVTSIGRIMRKTSLDELPQLWNVLRGEMSLVGPRPVTEEEIARYGASRAAYFSVLPGVTGLWQVSGRNRLTYDERVALDRFYAQRVSLKSDLIIIARTAQTLLSANGR